MSARARNRRLALLALVASAALGCARRHPDHDGRWVADAERRHALADQQLEAGDLPGARASLRAIVDARVPGEIPTGVRRAILQDTYFRLAELDLKVSDPRAALATADRGLALGSADDRDDLFVANLLVVRGAAHEALDDGADAAADYHAALVINDRLLAEALRGGTDAVPAPGGRP